MASAAASVHEFGLGRSSSLGLTDKGLQVDEKASDRSLAYLNEAGKGEDKLHFGL